MAVVVFFRQAERILGRARLQMRAAMLLQAVFAAALVVAGAVSPTGVQVGSTDLSMFVIVVVGLTWFGLLLRSLKLGHALHHATALISHDQANRAVPLLVEMLGQFSLLRMPKLMAVQYLARIAYDRQDFTTAAVLAAEIMRHPLARRRGLTVRACMVLADSLIELGDADGAGQALASLDGRRLGITEQANLLPVLLRWQMLSDRYDRVVRDLQWKVRLAELLPARQACTVHVLLAAACRHEQMIDASRFLLRRAGLHYDLDKLARRNPSVASYLVQMQATRDEPAEALSGRTAYGTAAGGTALIDDEAIDTVS